MNSRIGVRKICVTHRKHTASFKIAGSLLAIAPLWLMLATANTSARRADALPVTRDWTQFHRDNMQRWNPYETVLGVGNAGNLQLKWTNPIIPDQLTSEPAQIAPTSPVVANGVVYVGLA